MWKLMLLRVSFVPIIPLILFLLRSLSFYRHKHTLQFWTILPPIYKTEPYSVNFISTQWVLTCVCVRYCKREISPLAIVELNLYSIFMIFMQYTWYVLCVLEKNAREKWEWDWTTGYMSFVAYNVSLCIASLHFKQFFLLLLLNGKIHFFSSLCLSIFVVIMRLHFASSL